MASQRSQGSQQPVGASQALVAAQGIRADGVLVGADGTLRYLLDVTADPDRPDVRPTAAWRALLAALPAGWSLRVFQAVWPDPGPRAAFQAAVAHWPQPEHPGRRLLYESLQLFLDQASLPYARRTLLELAVPTALERDVGAFLDGAIALLSQYGLLVVPLETPEIVTLVRAICNPEVPA
jgi:hypothetical protein